MTTIPSSFDDAKAYERFMGRWSARLAETFLDFAGVHDAEQVLDVGAGTGSLALAIARRAPSCQVIGIDPSASYVAFAQTRTDLPAVRFETGDAQALPFAAARFDRTLCQLIFNFIPDPAKAAKEMRRVTRPGGVVATAQWDFEHGGMQMLDKFWEAAGSAAKNLQLAGERSNALGKEDMRALWSDAGLQAIEIADLEISTDFESFDAYWAPFLLGQGPAGTYAASLSPADQSGLRDRLRALILRDRADGPLSLPARAFAIRGIVP